MNIEARGLRMRLGQREVLCGLDLAAHAGEMTAVIGPNGAGKSTLLKILAGLLKPASGTVLLDGRPAADRPAAERARILAYLPQERTVHWALSARAVVALGRLPHQPMGARENAKDAQTIEAALAAMDISALADRPVLEMSGGERARVLVARALAQEPGILLADEPASGLDPAHQLELFQHLAKLSSAGRTVVLALHDLSLAARFCHRLILMRDGRCMAAGPPAKVLQREHLAAVYRVEAEYDVVRGTPVVLVRDVLP